MAVALGRAMLGIAFVVAVVQLFARHAMPRVLDLMLRRAKHEELFLLGVVSIAMLTAVLTEMLGLSLDLGAFFAGLMFAGTKYMDRTITLVRPLANVFGGMLFASIGMIINPGYFWNNLGSILMVVFVLFATKLACTTAVVRVFGYSVPTAMVTAMGLSHVGEFSLLFSSKLGTLSPSLMLPQNS